MQNVIDLLGLNLDSEVRSQRSKAYEDAARAAGEERWDELHRCAMRHRPHSLAARVILQRVAPDRLPSAADEMGDLIDSLWRELCTLLNELQDLRARSRPIRGMDERQPQVLIWALIVLRNDPPAGDQETIDAYLGELLAREPIAIRTEILRLFRPS